MTATDSWVGKTSHWRTGSIRTVSVLHLLPTPVPSTDLLQDVRSVKCGSTKEQMTLLHSLGVNCSITESMAKLRIRTYCSQCPRAIYVVLGSQTQAERDKVYSGCPDRGTKMESFQQRKLTSRQKSPEGK